MNVGEEQTQKLRLVPVIGVSTRLSLSQYFTSLGLKTPVYWGPRSNREVNKYYTGIFSTKMFETKRLDVLSLLP